MRVVLCMYTMCMYMYMYVMHKVRIWTEDFTAQSVDQRFVQQSEGCTYNPWIWLHYQRFIQTFWQGGAK